MHIKDIMHIKIQQKKPFKGNDSPFVTLHEKSTPPK